MATSRCCVWISNSEYNKWKAIWQQADAVFEFQIPSTTNEKQYGENLLLLLLLLIHKRKKKNYASVSEAWVNVVHSSFK
jgi:hypothetical protein